MEYPIEITSEDLTKIAHVTDAEIENDIRDTNVEIRNLEKEKTGHQMIADANLGASRGRMAAFMADGKSIQIKRRKEFVAFLQRVQKARANHDEDYHI